MDMQLDEAVQLLDVATYFDMKKEKTPTDLAGIAYYLEQEEIIVKQDNGLYSITNMGAILFAKRLSDFSKISRKAIVSRKTTYNFIDVSIFYGRIYSQHVFG